MQIQAELNVYPLGTDAVGERVKLFVDGLSMPGITVYPGPMSTIIAGEDVKVFRLMREAGWGCCWVFTLATTRSVRVRDAWSPTRKASRKPPLA